MFMRKIRLNHQMLILPKRSNMNGLFGVLKLAMFACHTAETENVRIKTTKVKNQLVFYFFFLHLNRLRA